MNILKYLTEEQISTFIKFKTFNSNQVIFNEHSLCEEIGILLEGEILINTYTYNEKEETITQIKENECFGQYLVFSKKPFYLGTAITKRKSRVAFISKNNLLKLFNTNNKFLESYLNMICTESLNIKQQAKMLAHKNIRDRIMFYLKQHSNNYIVNIKSVTDLANTLSIPRPSISRELSKMEKEGIIKKIDNTIYIKKFYLS